MEHLPVSKRHRTQQGVEGTLAPVLVSDRGQTPKPQGGAPNTPDLRSAAHQNIMQ